MTVATTCTKRYLIDPAGPRTADNIAACGKPGIVMLVGDGHRSYYCEEHAQRDAQGFLRGLPISN